MYGALRLSGKTACVGRPNWVVTTPLQNLGRVTNVVIKSTGREIDYIHIFSLCRYVIITGTIIGVV